MNISMDSNLVEKMNIAELGVFVSVCMSALVGLCFAIQKSKCDDISFCWGLCSIHRPQQNATAREEEEIQENENGENNNIV